MIDLIANIIIMLCLLVLATAIIINFFETNRNVAKEKKSIVETGSMTGFFVFFYLLLRFKIGYLTLPGTVPYVLKIAGIIFIVSGTYVNIRGRKELGSNWANQVTIYSDQKLVQTGVYKYVRHPLYSSIILMFYGACLVYPNYLAFLSNTFVFVPFMVYRAKQEEKLLSERFSGYTGYKGKTGMLFPKIFKR